MKIVVGYPPIWDELRTLFGGAVERAIFCWGDTIYNPSGQDIPASLIAHEEVHCVRQGDDIEGWWRRYMDAPEFRLAEEIPAHRAEYHAAIRGAANRNERRGTEKMIAARLSRPLYGRLIPLHEARKLIKEPTL